MLKAEVYITYKKTISNPQGLAVKHALLSLGYQNLKEVRVGKLITMRLNTTDKKEAEKTLNEMCRKLLANPVIEDYSFKIDEE